jgi:hypothetical protein
VTYNRRGPRTRATNARYAIDDYKTMPAQDLRNRRRFEEVLAGKHEFIFAISIHDNSVDSAKGEPVCFRPCGSCRIKYGASVSVLILPT